MEKDFQGKVDAVVELALEAKKKKRSIRTRKFSKTLNYVKSTTDLSRDLLYTC